VRPSKPVFQSVADLGLRDVGVKNDPRRLAAGFGTLSVALVVGGVVSTAVMCAIVHAAGADAWVTGVFALAWPVGVLALALRWFKRSAPVVVKLTAKGVSLATWLVLADLLLLVAAAVLLAGPALLPLVALPVIMALLAWRGRGRVPGVVDKVRAHLAADESVAGDGIGLARGVGGGRAAFRLVVATDRRLLVGTTTERFLLVDVPYRRVSRFGIEWKYKGRIGELSLTVTGVDDTPAETYLISSIAPANLVSIALALRSQGVEADDPEAVSEAERAWEQARRRGESPERLFDRQAMATRDFDLGLWLLLGLSAVAFYVDPLGGLGVPSDAASRVLLETAALCVVCGYVSGTRASLAYIAPLNLLVVPTFFFVADAGDVIIFMLVLSAVAAVGLAAGSALRRASAEPARSGLRHALSGLAVTRVSGMGVVAVITLVAVASAAGFEPSKLRLAVEQATAKQLPVDGRSNLAGNAASFTYTPGPGLKELIKDEHFDAGPNDGARWELRSSFTEGYNVLSLAHYVFVPRLDNAAAVAGFVADKDRYHSSVAGFPVTHTERVVDGRKGYVWNHHSRDGFWQYTAWFPQPVHSVRVECVTRTEARRFRRFCSEAIRSLEFH
jgi:hypothetical protein